MHHQSWIWFPIERRSKLWNAIYIMRIEMKMEDDDEFSTWFYRINWCRYRITCLVPCVSKVHAKPISAVTATAAVSHVHAYNRSYWKWWQTWQLGRNCYHSKWRQNRHINKHSHINTDNQQRRRGRCICTCVRVCMWITLDAQWCVSYLHFHTARINSLKLILPVNKNYEAQ